jgi:hypothetical protein
VFGGVFYWFLVQARKVNSQDVEFWSLDPPLATARCGMLEARVDLTRPQAGLHQLRLNAAPLDGRLLAFLPGEQQHWPAKLVDSYVRGEDLVATYEQSGEWPYAPQIYWRVTPGATQERAGTSLSLLVSIQTSLLDTHPRVDVVSELAADELLCIYSGNEPNRAREKPLAAGEHTVHATSETCALLWRLAGGQFSYVEIATASDFLKLTATHRPNAPSQSRWELFAEFLEKGVIRRAQLQIAILPREDDVQLAAQLCREIERRPLPLTT